MKYFVFILFLLFVVPIQAAERIYALDVYAPKELVGEDCRTFLIVLKQQ